MKTNTKLLLSSAVIVASILSVPADIWAMDKEEVKQSCPKKHKRLERRHEEDRKKIEKLRKENKKLNNEVKEIKKPHHKNPEKPTAGKVSQGVPINRSDYYLDKYREYLQDTSRRDRD